jgi:hypothetical protein
MKVSNLLESVAFVIAHSVCRLDLEFLVQSCTCVWMLFCVMHTSVYCVYVTHVFICIHFVSLLCGLLHRRTKLASFCERRRSWYRHAPRDFVAIARTSHGRRAFRSNKTVATSSLLSTQLMFIGDTVLDITTDLRTIVVAVHDEQVQLGMRCIMLSNGEYRYQHSAALVDRILQQPYGRALQEICSAIGKNIESKCMLLYVVMGQLPSHMRLQCDHTSLRACVHDISRGRGGRLSRPAA